MAPSAITPTSELKGAAQVKAGSTFLRHLRHGLALLLFSAPFFFESAHSDTSDVFGATKQSEAAMMGIMYDLKQTPDGKPTNVDPGTYCDVLDEYLSKNWDERVLEGYYKVIRPLYTTQIFIPNMDANNAPKAFGAEKTVQPSRWVIHYKAQVTPPADGTYRFWGCADDIMAVAVNGKTSLVGPRPDLPLKNTTWKSTEGDGPQAADDALRAGDWFTAKAGEILDLDVIIGERPGGFFNAFVMIEKQGENYPKDVNGRNILPIFQVAPFDTPVIDDLNSEPKFSKGFPVWKSFQ